MRRRIILLIVVLLLVLTGVICYVLFGDLPAPDSAITRSSPDATKILDRNGRLLYEILDPRAGRRTRIPLTGMPRYFREGVIAVEDSNFYENPGVDAVGIARSIWNNLRAGTIVMGGSTITQQIARELLLSKDERESRSYLRKLREAVLAIRLTQTFTKDQILEMYLNEIYFGNLAYGVEAASRTYFGKPARDLDLAESALLAGMIQSPTLCNPFVNLDAAMTRQRTVLGLMVKNGYLKDSESQMAAAEPLHFVGVSVNATIHAPHFVAYVRNLLEDTYGAETVNHGGLTVVTTLDLDLQERAESIIRQQLDELERRKLEDGSPDFNVHDASLVAVDPASGEILAMVGSADYFDEKIDGAVNVALANRQPGSAIKPITYAAAFSRDYTPATVLSDVPTSFLTKEHLPYEPQNYDRIWHGPISLRQALATSNNMIAVKVLDHVGIKAMVDLAGAMGISTFQDSDRFGLALTLGGGEVKLLDLTSAFATFANKGLRVEPRAIRSVNGQKTSDSEQPQVVSPQVAYLITSILSDDSARIGAFGEDSVLQLSRPAAAKTGTTTDFKDNWTLGYAEDLAVGVWVGNADNTPMYKTSGVTGAGPIWHDFMEAALRSRPGRIGFERPGGLVDVEICDTSGLLATDLCPRRRMETFVSGTEPTASDNSYIALGLDSATGLLWTEGCRGQRVDRVFRVMPPEATDWGEKQGISMPPSTNCLGQASPQIAFGSQPSALGLRSLARSAGLTITSPAPNSIFSVSSQIPIDFQKIELSARQNDNRVSSVSLVVDGQVIGTFSRSPFRSLWSLVPGNHTVVAVGVDSDGKSLESDPISFQVEQGSLP